MWERSMTATVAVGVMDASCKVGRLLQGGRLRPPCPAGGRSARLPAP